MFSRYNREMEYNKLVRDKIPEIIAGKGETAETRTASPEEYWLKLKEKLSEEVAEFKTAENQEELADILEVIDAIIAHKGFNPEEIQRIQTEKATERGRFEKRIILVSS